MRNIVLLILLFVLFGNVHSNAQYWQWAIQPQVNYWAEPSAICSDGDDNIYVAGKFTSDSLVWGGIKLLLQSASSNTVDGFLLKFSKNGVPLLGTVIGTYVNDKINSVTVDQQGNIYIVGVNGGGDLRVGGVTMSTTCGANIQGYVLKLDSLFQPLWIKCLGNDTGDIPYNVEVDSGGYVYITGNFDEAAIYFDGVGVVNAYNTTNDIYLLKLDSAGAVQWVRGIGGNSDDVAYDLELDPFGNILLTGQFMSDTLWFGNSFLPDASSGISSSFLCKLDTSGSLIWTIKAGGPGSGRCYGNSIAIDSVGNIYSTGAYTGSNLMIDTIPLPYYGTADIYVYKCDSSGLAQWVQTAGGYGDDMGVNLALDEMGNTIVIGTFASTYLNLSMGTLYNTYFNSIDIFVISYDTIGDLNWATKAGGSVADYGVGVAIADQGGIYTTGKFVSSNFTAGAISLPPSGGTGMFLARIGSSATGLENEQSLPASIWPNPTNGNFRLSGVPDQADVKLFSLVGIQVAEFNQVSSDETINLNLPDGVYILKVIAGGKTLVGKVVVAR